MNNKFRTVRGYELESYNKNSLTPAMEDYLEMIYRYSLKESYIRINTLAGLLNVKDSSASKMVKNLAELGLVNSTKYSVVTLTDKGKSKGKILLNRHNIIERFLELIGCKEDKLIQTELIEHFITPDTVSKIEVLCKFFDDNGGVMEKYNKIKMTTISNIDQE